MLAFNSLNGLPRCVFLASALLTLHGCTSLSRTTPSAAGSPATSEQHSDQLRQLQQWQLRGKLGLKTPRQSGSAYINWKQAGDDYNIHLSGPLGHRSTRIHAEQGEVTLSQSGEEPISATSAEALMQQTLGWWLPVSDLHFWVKGIPAPDISVDTRKINPDGTLARLEQNGWQITYTNYQFVPPYQLPSRLSIERSEIKATLIIKQWQLQP